MLTLPRVVRTRLLPASASSFWELPSSGMRRATAVSSLLVISSLIPCASQAQDAQPPVFRSGVELLEVDVNIVDRNGRPIVDLRAPEFSVKVDGQDRKVASSEFVRDDASQAADLAYKEDPYVATNSDRPRGRMIIIVVDQNNITAGRARDLITSVRKFVEQ